MDLKDKHIIQGKWVDCKRAVPASKMKDDGTPEIIGMPLKSPLDLISLQK